MSFRLASNTFVFRAPSVARRRERSGAPYAAGLSLLLLLVAPSVIASEGEQVPKGAASKETGGSAPEEWLSVDCGRELKFWRRPKKTPFQAYCARVAQASVRMLDRPKEALEMARAALVLVPRGDQAKWLVGQGLFATQEISLAQAVFDECPPLHEDRKRQPANTQVLITAARTALLSARYESSLTLYRSVILRLNDVPSARQRARILVEAATAAAYAGPDNGREARNFLSLAKGTETPLLGETVQAATVLSYFREGNMEAAKRAAHGFESGWGLHFVASRVSAEGEVEPVLPKGEAFAFAAAVAEIVDPESRELHWEEFYEAAGDLPAHLRRSK